MSVEEDLARLKRRIDNAKTARARSEVEVEQAEQHLVAARSQLQAQFGITTTEEIRATLTRLSEEFTAEVTRIEQHLEDAGA